MEILKWLHVVSGSIALIAGSLALIVKKGSRVHRKSGKFFGYSMVFAGVSSIVLSILIESIFLLGIGLFSTWNVLLGILVFKLKDFGWRGPVIPITAVSLIGTMGIGSIAVVRALELNFDGMFWLSVIFGLGGTGFLIYRIVELKKYNAKPLDRVAEHINFMISAYIASMSAFSATQLYFIPGVLRWIWPTLLFSPIIAYQINQWKKHKSKSRSSS